MTPRVLAIGLDSFGFPLLQEWLAEGRLPHLDRLRRRGGLGVLRGVARYQDATVPFSNTEGLWVSFLTGLAPDQTGYWTGMRYDPRSYRATSDAFLDGYDYAEHPPFYALAGRCRVVAFDLPVSRVCAGVEGVQICGWGGHAPFTFPDSRPAGLLDEISRRHGPNRLVHADHGEFWDGRYLRWLVQTTRETLRQRSAVCRELMAAHPWDLFLTAFGETHSAAHDLWFAGRDHPLNPRAGGGHDPMLEAYQAVDRAVGEIIAAAPPEAHVLCYSLHGMGPNATDLASTALLPEVLYRWSFPGRVGLAPGAAGEPAAVVTSNVREFWGAEVWRRRWEARPLRRWLKDRLPSRFVGAGRTCDLESPYQVGCQSPHLGWMPAAWYQRLWPRMKAFALPAFTDGHVRINLCGRDPHGQVAPSDYDAVCAEVTELVRRLRHGRTGEPLVKEVHRTRGSAAEDGPKLLPADLVIRWRAKPVDVLDSPDVGRVGPLPYYRTGGHHPNGFLLACGPGIEPGCDLPAGRPIDLAPTILGLLGRTAPAHFPGRPLLEARPAST